MTPWLGVRIGSAARSYPNDRLAIQVVGRPRERLILIGEDHDIACDAGEGFARHIPTLGEHDADAHKPVVKPLSKRPEGFSEPLVVSLRSFSAVHVEAVLFTVDTFDGMKDLLESDDHLPDGFERGSAVDELDDLLILENLERIVSVVERLSHVLTVSPAARDFK